MPRELMAAAMAALALFTFRARIEHALVVLVSVTLLTPSALRLPGGPGNYLTFHRLILLTFVLNVAVRWRRGEISGDAFRSTPVHIALIGYAAVAFIVGIMFGDPLIPTSGSLYLWVFIVDQVITFIVVLAAIRAIGDPTPLARVVAAVATLAALIAVFEHFTRLSYNSWFFASVPEQRGSPGSGALLLRGGDVRVRAAVDYPLAYAWVATMALPIVATVTSRIRGLVWLAAPGVVAVTILWTYARSAYVGALAAVALVALASRFDRRITRLALIGSVIALAIAVSTGAIARTFEGTDARDSSEGRANRAPVVLAAAAEDPFTGAGLAYLSHEGISSTDSSYLQLYVEIGIIGAISFALLLIFTLRCVLPGLLAPPGPRRSLAAAIVAALAAGIVAPSFLDSFGVSSFYRTFWILAAIGVALAEQVDVPWARVSLFPRRRLALVPVGAAMGIALWMTMPAVGTETYRFDSIPLRFQARGIGQGTFIGRTYMKTACTAMEEQGAGLGDTKVSCFDLRTRTGFGQVRIDAPPDVIRRRARAVLAAGRASIRGFRPLLLERRERSKPNWVRTAPVWGAGAGALVLMVLPGAPFPRSSLPRGSPRTPQPGSPLTARTRARAAGIGA